MSNTKALNTLSRDDNYQVYRYISHRKLVEKQMIMATTVKSHKSQKKKSRENRQVALNLNKWWMVEKVSLKESYAFPDA